MTSIKANITLIEELLAQGSPQGATYAALECRLAIERICYERLRVAHDYISHEDLRRWQPKDVVNTLIAEVDGHIASTFTLSMGRQPLNPSSPELTEDDFEGVEWVEIGTQVGFDPQKLGKLWHSLSNLALHVRLPRSKDDPIPAYGDEGEIRTKVADTLAELKKLASGTLVSSGLGTETSFNCECGRLNKRRAKLLKDRQVVSCIGPECKESYTVSIEEQDIFFTRRLLEVDCKCGKKHVIPTRRVEQLARDEHLLLECPCGNTTKVAWRLMQQA